ncbi:hypothetical protein AB0L41_45840 [Amycolatopsis mediterranei]|uniref:hypothetical protein n=1 Tax=Amycolatopsis mediterranei TaxID=33910 RepID=UPI00342B5303
MGSTTAPTFLGATESFPQDIELDEYSSNWPSYAVPEEVIGELRASLDPAAGQE